MRIWRSGRIVFSEPPASGEIAVVVNGDQRDPVLIGVRYRSKNTPWMTVGADTMHRGNEPSHVDIVTEPLPAPRTTDTLFIEYTYRQALRKTRYVLSRPVQPRPDHEGGRWVVSLARPLRAKHTTPRAIEEQDVRETRYIFDAPRATHAHRTRTFIERVERWWRLRRIERDARTDAFIEW